MKNITIIVLVVLLVAAIIPGFLLYGKYRDMKDTLRVSNKELLGLNERVAQLDREKSKLNDQIRDDPERLKELESAKVRISQLEDATKVRDQALSSLDEKIRKLEEGSKEERKIAESLRKELTTKDEMLARLQEKLQGEITKHAEPLKELESARLRISQLEDAIKIRDQALSSLDEKIRKLEEGSKEERKIAEFLRKELTTKDEMFARLQEKLQGEIEKDSERLKELESAKVRISQLEDAINVKDQTLSSLDEKIHRLEEGSEEEKKIGESLREELSSMDEMLARLQEKIQMEKSMAKAKIEELKSTYDSLVSDLKGQLKNKEMTIREFEKKLSITFVERVLFDFGKATITPEGRAILTRVGKILKNVHGMKIRVVGHTDNRPIRKDYLSKFPSNWELSSTRAAAVVRYFQRKSGLDPKSCEVVGMSFYRPVTSNETQEGRARNRRVEVIIAPMIEK